MTPSTDMHTMRASLNLHQVAFKGIDVLIGLGAFPRGPGMERKDLLNKNVNIFKAQGRLLNEVRTCARAVVHQSASSTAAWRFAHRHASWLSVSCAYCHAGCVPQRQGRRGWQPCQHQRLGTCAGA